MDGSDSSPLLWGTLVYLQQKIIFMILFLLKSIKSFALSIFLGRLRLEIAKAHLFSEIVFVVQIIREKFRLAFKVD